MANASILAAFERMWQHVVLALSNKSDIDHNHDEVYASINEATTQVEDDGEGNVILTNVAVEEGAIVQEKDPTVPAWAKNPNPPTAAEIGAAPAGFGLGATLGKDVSSTDFNTITANGWYYFNYGGPNMPDPTLGYSYMFVCAREGAVTQYIFQSNIAAYAGCVYKRTMFNGVWGEWEWVNPPMQLGVEYRTTERYMGKPVYIKAVDCGEMPSAGTHKNIVVTYGLPEAHKIVGLECVFESEHYGEYALKRYCVNYCTETNNSGEIKGITWAYSSYDSVNVTIKALGDLSNYSAVATVKYVK